MLIERTDKNTKVTITETTTPEELEAKFPMLKVKSDSAGQYIRTPHCRFLPGTYFMLGYDDIPGDYFSIQLKDTNG